MTTAREHAIQDSQVHELRGDVLPLEAAEVTEEDLQVLRQVRRLRAAAGRHARPMLQQALMASGVDLVEPAAVAQAQRNAQLRNALLATPCYSFATLRQVRGDASVATTRAAVRRARTGHRLLAVSVDGRVIIPAFQLTDRGTPRPELAPLIESVSEAGLSAWAIWVWLTSPTGLLSGLVPHVAAADPATRDRAERAARRYADRLRATVAG